MSTRAFIGLGSNLGDRAEHIAFGLRGLAALSRTQLVTNSELYESPPFGPPDQPDYLNAAAELTTELPAQVLLEGLLAIEREAGRVRSLRNGPRTLDLDLLIFGDQSIDKPSLVVPHPRLRERGFVLKPLLDLDPELVIPGDAAPVSGWLECCPGADLVRRWRPVPA